MSLNLEVFNTLIGKLKLTTVVIGVVDLGLTADSYVKVSNEEFFLAIVIINFIISFVWLIVYIVGILQETNILSKIDTLYHLIGGLLLLISMITWFVSISDRERITSSGKYIEAVFSGIFGLVNSILYLGIGALLFKSSGIVG